MSNSGSTRNCRGRVFDVDFLAGVMKMKRKDLKKIYQKMSKKALVELLVARDCLEQKKAGVKTATNYDHRYSVPYQKVVNNPYVWLPKNVKSAKYNPVVLTATCNSREEKNA